MLLSKYNRNNTPEFLLTSDWKRVNIAVDLEQSESAAVGRVAPVDQLHRIC